MTRLILFTIITILCACSKNPDIPTNTAGDCANYFEEKDFNLDLQKDSQNLPSNVSVFFRVSDDSGNPISELETVDFNIYERGINDDCFDLVSKSESEAKILSNEQIFRYYTYLVLDLSPSVTENYLQELKDASKSFVKNIMPEIPEFSNQLGIWWFDGADSLFILQELTVDRDLVFPKIIDINNNLSMDNSTNLYGSVIKASELAQKGFESTPDSVVHAASIVIFTDGRDQAARYTKEAAFKAVEDLDESISIYTIGLGDEIDESILGKIGVSGSSFAEDKRDLEIEFDNVSQQISNEAKSYYVLEYCSPKRGGLTELTIELVKNDKRGSLQSNFDANGFTQGCN